MLLEFAMVIFLFRKKKSPVKCKPKWLIPFRETIKSTFVWKTLFTERILEFKKNSRERERKNTMKCYRKHAVRLPNQILTWKIIVVYILRIFPKLLNFFTCHTHHETSILGFFFFKFLFNLIVHEFLWNDDLLMFHDENKSLLDSGGTSNQSGMNKRLFSLSLSRSLDLTLNRCTLNFRTFILHHPDFINYST